MYRIIAVLFFYSPTILCQDPGISEMDLNQPTGKFKKMAPNNLEPSESENGARTKFSEVTKEQSSIYLLLCCYSGIKNNLLKFN